MEYTSQDELEELSATISELSQIISTVTVKLGEVSSRLKRIQTSSEKRTARKKRIDKSNLSNIDQIHECIVSIKNGRNYSKLLGEIKQNLHTISLKMTVDDYSAIVSGVIRQLVDIFNDKKYESNKIQKLVSKGTTPLDMRLSMSKDYFKINIDADSIEQMKRMIANESMAVKVHNYEYVEFCHVFTNYGMCMFDIDKTVSEILVSLASKKQYVSIETDGDMVCVLFQNKDRTTNDGRGLWTRHRTLTHLGYALHNYLFTYAIRMFRKIHIDVFADNTFRRDSGSSLQIVEFEYEQLLSNIFMMSNPTELAARIHRNIGVSIGELSEEIVGSERVECDESILENFDDIYIKQFKFEEIDMKELCRQLFDDVTDADVGFLIEKYANKFLNF